MTASTKHLTPRLDAANEAQSRQALDSTRLGGGGFCLVCGIELVATDPPGNAMCRTCLKRADLYRLTVQPVVTTGVPVVKTNDPVARRAGYTENDLKREPCASQSDTLLDRSDAIGTGGKADIIQRTTDPHPVSTLRSVPGYHCPGCGAVFGTNIKLAAHFADCPNCEGAADWARVKAGLPIRSKL